LISALSWLLAVALEASISAAQPALAPDSATLARAISSTEVKARAPSTTHSSAADGHRLHWQYPRFRLWQYAASGAISGLNVFIESAGSPYPDSRDRGTIALDLLARNALRLSSARGRETVAEISDYLWHGTQYFGVAEAIVVPLVFDRGNFDVAWQATMVNWQVLGLAFLGTRLTHLTLSRARPSEYGCSSEANAGRPCTHAGPSFLSGHTSMSAAGAASACWHHYALKLYGGGWPDTAVCIALASTTVAIGVMRIAADKHWATDVLTGMALGTGVGVGVPYLLHYGNGPVRPLGAGILPNNVALFPSFDSDGFGLSLGGWL
jgi:membrane-associated phospholipid phosphatase